MLQRFEFAPIDFGIDLESPLLQRMVIDIAKNEGWQDISHQFDSAEIHAVLPRSVGILQKQHICLFIPESGFAVARYHFITKLESDLTQMIAQQLLERVHFHRAIEKNIIDKKHSILVELIEKIRNALRSKTPNSLRMQTTKKLHLYALSVFFYTGETHHPCLQALLSPRLIGCSANIPNEQTPTIDKIKQSIQQLNTPLKSGLNIQVNTSILWSSWSTVLVATKSTPLLSLPLVSLIQFRLQTLWLAAHRIGELASNYSTINYSSTPRLSINFSIRDAFELNLLQQLLLRLYAEYNQRLGANAPPDPTAILNQLETTSDIENEFQNSISALNYAVLRAKYISEHKNAKGRKLIELFSLIFASSGLATMLVPLPLNLSVIKDNFGAFIAWLLLTLVGGILILRQH